MHAGFDRVEEGFTPVPPGATITYTVGHAPAQKQPSHTPRLLLSDFCSRVYVHACVFPALYMRALADACAQISLENFRAKPGTQSADFDPEARRLLAIRSAALSHPMLLPSTARGCACMPPSLRLLLHVYSRRVPRSLRAARTAVSCHTMPCAVMEALNLRIRSFMLVINDGCLWSSCARACIPVMGGTWRCLWQPLTA